MTKKCFDSNAAKILILFNLFFSPNYPFPYQTNVVCRYFIYGMQDEQNLERVKLTFDKFNIPMATDHTCEDGYLKVK